MKQKPMDNAQVTSDIRAIFDSWWKCYRDEPVTDALLDRAYDHGAKLLEQHQSKLAFDMFVNLFRVLEARRAKT